MLGHSTGRLLLMRRGFQLDMEKVVAAARESGTAIELNANPRRLDVDWRFLPLLFSHGVKTAINPDAHVPAGIDDMQHGVDVARKAGTTPAHVLNCLGADELARYFKEARG
jgi:DNA polymerase (family 10)